MKKFILILFVLSTVGCASFKGNQVTYQQLKDQSNYQNLPSVYINLTASSNHSRFDSERFISSIKNKLNGVFDNSKVFSAYSFDNNDVEKMDYQLNIHIRNEGSEGLAYAAGYLTGYTLGVVPTFTTVDFFVETTLFKSNNQMISSNESDYVRHWVGLWLLPFMTTNKSEDATWDVIRNLIIRGLNKMIDEGKLQYSSLQLLPSVG